MAVVSANSLKIIVICVTMGEALIFGLIPLHCKAFNNSPKVLSFANAFTGGVFLATSILHVLPAQIERFTALNNGKGFDVPCAFLIIGYIIILLIDKILFNTDAIFEHAAHESPEHRHEQTIYS